MKNIIYLFASSILLLSAVGCSKITPIDVDNKPQSLLLERDMEKWAKEKELQKAQDESDAAFKDRVKKMYDEYYKDLREYKNSDHRIVYGWFSGWAATEGVERSFLSNVPDSVDIIALWGGVGEFDEKDSRWEDLRIAQEVKGLKVVLCWQTGASGLGLPGGVEAFNKRHQGKSSVQKAKAYAEELTNFIKKHNLNGYDIDWEPNVGDHSHGAPGNNLYNNDTDPYNRREPIRVFIEEMGKNFGPKATSGYTPRGTKSVFLFDGEIADMASGFGDLGGYFDYFINQNYYSVGPNHEMRNTGLIAEWNWKKYVQADEFEKFGATGGYGNGNPSMAERKAEQNKAMNYGGWAAYHIELDKGYKWTNKVIKIMNPHTAFYPEEHKDNKFLEK
ncbi:MAG: glycoside hydrolase family 18 [Candidatus Cryptobacteroides sp.]